jgi:PTS system nitrogen regulatory IIA component
LPTSKIDLSLSQMAACLNVAETTLERWVRQGRIPVERIGGECRFNQSALERWAKDHHMSFSLSETEAKPAAVDTGSLVEAMARGGVHRGISGEGISGVLKNAVDRLTMLSAGVRDELYDRLVSREQLSSTGVGRGVAIPHPRNPLSEAKDLPLIATFYLDAPVDFHAVDDKPVFVLFILIGASIDSHLRLLSRLAFCLRDDAFLAFLRDRPEADALLERIAVFEQHLTETGY